MTEPGGWSTALVAGVLGAVLSCQTPKDDSDVRTPTAIAPASGGTGGAADASLGGALSSGGDASGGGASLGGAELGPDPVPGPPARGPSCVDPAGGDDSRLDPCESSWVPGGSYPMGFSPEEVGAAPELDDLEREVFVSGFFLDRYEVTLGRFLAYARAYAGPPAAGQGAHPRVAESGWQSAWDEEMPGDAAGLLELASCGAATDPLGARAQAAVAMADAGLSSTPDAGLDSGAGDVSATERILRGRVSDPTLRRLPMACASWFVAQAFCIWDGGRLPTEAEWEFAAAGGAEDRTFPWGDDLGVLDDLDESQLSPVGSLPAARGAFGHEALAGGVLEWAFDWFSERFFLEAGAGCRDCINLERSTGRVVRGTADSDCCLGWASEYRSASRALVAPGVRAINLGMRCARDLR